MKITLLDTGFGEIEANERQTALDASKPQNWGMASNVWLIGGLAVPLYVNGSVNSILGSTVPFTCIASDLLDFKGGHYGEGITDSI